jgi:hypothetical protein
MQPTELKSFENRTEGNSKIYSYEEEEAELTQKFIKHFRSNKRPVTTFNHWHLHIEKSPCIG